MREIRKLIQMLEDQDIPIDDIYSEHRYWDADEHDWLFKQSLQARYPEGSAHFLMSAIPDGDLIEAWGRGLKEPIKGLTAEKAFLYFRAAAERSEE